MKMRISLSCVALVIGGVVHGQNLVVNGDLEDTTAVNCDFNNDNASFTAKMADATAFGEANELDIIETPGCPGDFGFPARSGLYKVGMHKQSLTGAQDAFSLELSSPVIAGQSYTLTFYASLLATSRGGTVEVGLSSSPTDFGTLVASGDALSATAWTEHTSSFVAPVDAAHLTVRQAGTFLDTYSFVDDFTLEVAAECFLVLGSGPGITAFTPTVHTFWPQVDEVVSHYPVLMNDIPSFPLASPIAGPTSPFASASLINTFPELHGIQEFHVQVLMWNPLDFPLDPEQWTNGLRVVVLPDGRLFTRYYGDSHGEMTLWPETYRNEQGEWMIRFPFQVRGF